jgi:hypothetical protein
MGINFGLDELLIKDNFQPVSATMAITTGGAMGANDFIGVDHTPITFSNCARLPGGSGHITSAIFVDGDNQKLSGELWVFTVAPVGLPDQNAAFAVTAADLANCIGIFPFSTYYAAAATAWSRGIPAIVADFKCAAGSRDLYGAFVTRGAPTYTTGTPRFTLNIWQS